MGSKPFPFDDLLMEIQCRILSFTNLMYWLNPFHALLPPADAKTQLKYWRAVGKPEAVVPWWRGLSTYIDSLPTDFPLSLFETSRAMRKLVVDLFYSSRNFQIYGTFRDILDDLNEFQSSSIGPEALRRLQMFVFSIFVRVDFERDLWFDLLTFLDQHCHVAHLMVKILLRLLGWLTTTDDGSFSFRQIRFSSLDPHTKL